TGWPRDWSSAVCSSDLLDVTFAPFLGATLFDALYKPKRLLAYLPHLAARVFRRLRLARADVVFVQREAMLFGPPLVEWMASRRRSEERRVGTAGGDEVG